MVKELAWLNHGHNPLFSVIPEKQRSESSVERIFQREQNLWLRHFDLNWF